MVPSNSQTAAAGGPALAQAVEAALAWWQEAGVDGDWLDAAQDWLARPTPTAPGKGGAASPSAAPAEPAPAPLLAGGPANWPTDAETFAAWWMTEPDLAPAGARRVPPAGPPAPPLMVVVPMPEAGDHDTLLSGPAGVVLDGFLRAAGLSRAQIYCAAALPARIAAPDWAALAQAGLGQLLMHHVALVRPQRLVLFGQNDISTLIGNASPNNPTHLQSINHDDAIGAPLWSYDLESIVARPALKAGLWSRWLDWMPA